MSAHRSGDSRTKFFKILFISILALSGLAGVNTPANASYVSPVTLPERFGLVAAGERATLFTATSSNATNLNNGSYWYYGRTGNSSMGFSPNSNIVQSSADIVNSSLSGTCGDGNDGALRLSWHTNSGNLTGGWRYGCQDWLNSSLQAVRGVYEASSPTYYPSGPQLRVAKATIEAGGWSLCYAGGYGESGKTLASLETDCDQTYLLYFGGAGEATLNTPTISSVSTTDTTARVFFGTVANASSYTLRIWSADTGGSILQTVNNYTSGTQITGLTTGTTYYATIRAIGSGAYYSSDESDPRYEFTAAPPVAPGTPGAPVAAPGDGQATVTITAPSTGGDPETYLVTASPGGETCTVTAPATSCVVSGLTNGTEYTFTATATNGGGTSGSSDPSNAITPVLTPGTPGAPVAEPGDGDATVTITPPSSGGTPTSYTVTASPGGATCTVTSPETSCVVTGLTNNTEYTFTATATNDGGTSAASPASNSVTPGRPGTPGAPTAVTGDGKATVTISAPVSGGAATSYTVTASPGGATCTVTSPETSCEVTGLTNGVAYTFTSTATNAAGTSASSPASNSITPVETPGAPGTPSALHGNGQALVSIVPPTSGGTPTSYIVTASPGGASCTVTVPATSCIVTGLSNGTAYTFTSVAVNDGGTSEASNASNEIVAGADGAGSTAISPLIRAFWTNVENCRLDMSKTLSQGDNVSTSTYQVCFFTGVNTSNVAAVNTALKVLIAQAAAAGSPMDHSNLMRAASQISDRLDLVERISTGKLVFASEFEAAGINLGAYPTRTLDTLKALPKSEIDTLEELLFQIAKVG